MRRVAAFLVAAAGALGLFALMATTPPSGLDFTRMGPGDKVYMDRLLGEIALDRKLAAADIDSRFDIGVFGNSRSLMVGAGDLGLAGCRCFNFSIGGASLRTSVAMLEDLTRRGKAPRLALVSLDHFEIGMMGHPEWLAPGTALRLMAGDLWALRGAPKDLARAAWRHAYVGWQKVKRVFSSSSALAMLRRASKSAESEGAPYLADGSRVTAPGTGGPLSFTPARGGEIIDALLAHDLSRLRALQDRPGGPESIIVYESPLAPVPEAALREKPTPAAQGHREAARRSCSALGLACILGGLPAAAGGPSSEPWPDATHAPAGELGARLRSIDGIDALTCGRRAP